MFEFVPSGVVGPLLIRATHRWSRTGDAFPFRTRRRSIGLDRTGQFDCAAVHVNQIEAEPSEATEINGGLAQFGECGEDTRLGLNRTLENASAATLLDDCYSVADTVEYCIAAPR